MATKQDGSSASPSLKRKMNSGPKFYAVKAGHKPGVYQDWKECQENLKGFKGASFKSFPTREEANDFVAGRVTKNPSKPAKAGTEKFYGVASGHVPGVYTEWSEAQEQISGWKGPKYRKFNTRAEAEAFVRGESLPVSSTPKPASKYSILTKNTTADAAGYDAEDDYEDEIMEQLMIEAEAGNGHSAKRAKNNPTSHLSRSDQENMATTSVIKTTTASKIKAPASSSTDAIKIYTDGSSLGNGKVGAFAGVGVFFGVGDTRNLSEALAGEAQTNQRAELTAVLRALEIAPQQRHVHIYTDSKYTIDCATVWYKRWETNNWVTAAKGTPVMNKDLIQGIITKIRERERLGAETVFNWVKGHSNDPSNEAADRLAVSGARRV